MAGIQLSAGYGIATTDENGNFLLRDLPAGDLTITVVPARPLPPDMKVPSGNVHMPADPIQVQGATIVISNPDLVPYLLGKTADEVRDSALHPGSKPAVAAAQPNLSGSQSKPAEAPASQVPATAASQTKIVESASVSTAAPAPVSAGGKVGSQASRARPQVESSPGKVAPGMLGSYEQRAVLQLTVEMTSCLLGHDCTGFQNNTVASSTPDGGPR
jgi:hypothetical protein